MTRQDLTLEELLQSEPRYSLQAYLFVRESLEYAHKVMGLGTAIPESAATELEPQKEHHVTAQELCEAARRHALDQYGLMSRIVLKQWGIESTSDIGEVVFNLIRIQVMKKSKRDRRQDFDNVFDFHEAFDKSFRITAPPAADVP
ncbi:MAG: hypothetical protein O3C60_16145 [Planctomycetota bacterium]|nr:hypothetical protein [Planctomycetota bacterium]